MSASNARAFEMWALKTIKSKPTAEWEAITSLWTNLRLIDLQTRERIIRRMVELTVLRGDPLPLAASKLLLADARPLPPAKELPRDIKLFRAAAEYSVGRENWRRAFAKSHGIDDTTIHQWQEKHPLAFKLASLNPDLPDDQIFSDVSVGAHPACGRGQVRRRRARQRSLGAPSA